MSRPTLKSVSAAYDRIYKKGEAVLKKLDPCGIKVDSEGNVTCNGSHIFKDRYIVPANQGRSPNMLCCINCEHYWEAGKGCTTKCLSCKLYLCRAVEGDWGKKSEAGKAMQKLRDEARDAGIPVKFFASKAEVMEFGKKWTGLK